MATRELEKKSKTIPDPPKRKRRSTEEILSRIVDAAVAEFSDKGYATTTTAAIARRAGVVEAQIFNHFGSKANLFREAIYRSLDDQFQAFLASHPRHDDDSVDAYAEKRAFIADLASFVRSHAGLFKSLIVNESSAYGKDENGPGLLVLQDYFNRMSELSSVRRNPHPKISPPLIARISFASIVACVLFDDWLFPRGVASRQEIQEGICDFVMDGLCIEPGSATRSQPPRQAKPRRRAS